MRFFSSFSHCTKSAEAGFTRMDIEVALRAAQITRHRPVDGPHVVEYKRVKSDFILLTLFRKRVKSHSFFDILKVFPVGGESGIQARSPCTAQAESIRRASENL